MRFSYHDRCISRANLEWRIPNDEVRKVASPHRSRRAQTQLREATKRSVLLPNLERLFRFQQCTNRGPNIFCQMGTVRRIEHRPLIRLLVGSPGRFASSSSSSAPRSSTRPRSTPRPASMTSRPATPAPTPTDASRPDTTSTGPSPPWPTVRLASQSPMSPPSRPPPGLSVHRHRIPLPTKPGT